MVTDPIAELLTCIRNGVAREKREVVFKRHFRFSEVMLSLLEREGFIEGFAVEGEGVKKHVVVKLKYGEDGSSAITSLKRISKPSCRVYVGKHNTPWVLNGVGLAAVSTSKGLLSDREARRDGIGGEVVFEVY